MSAQTVQVSAWCLTWSTVPSMSRVSVVVIVCSAILWSLPTLTLPICKSEMPHLRLLCQVRLAATSPQAASAATSFGSQATLPATFVWVRSVHPPTQKRLVVAVCDTQTITGIRC